MNKPKARSAEEHDCASRKARRVLGGGPGRWKAAKRAMNKRFRKEGKRVEE